MKVGNRAFYLFLDGIFGLGIGYIFWIIVAKLLGPSITGETSSAITLAIILATIFTFGISVGSQIFLGKSYSENNINKFQNVAKFSLMFTIVSISLTSLFFVFLQEKIIETFGMSFYMILIIIIATISYAIVINFRGIMISSLQTKKLFIIFLISNIIRFLFLIPIIVLDLGSEGITFSYVTFYLSATIMLFYSSRKYIFSTVSQKYLQISEKKEIIKASIAGWIPNAINSLGTNSSVLFVFGVKGPETAGIYFLCFAIFTALTTLPSSINSLLFPILSGMKKDREILLWKAMKSSFYIINPITIAIAFYPAPILSLFGEDFVSGTTILTLLAISIIPFQIHHSIGYLSYSYGRYKEVLIIGIVPNSIRLILYVILISEFGANGIAASLLIGTFSGLIIAIILNKIRNYLLNLKDILYFTLIPVGLATITLISEIPPILSAFIIILGSYSIISRLKIIRYSDIDEIVNSVFLEPTKTSKNLLSLAKIFFK